MTIKNGMSKVPAVTLGFWVIKIIATTLGETGGDAVSMTLDWGYAIGSAMFIGIFVLAVVAQIAAKSFHPSCTGWSSLPPRPPAPPWRTLLTARSVSAIPAGP
jgi:Uncharacterized membrane-anchored protein conserved in bacteria